MTEEKNKTEEIKKDKVEPKVNTNQGAAKTVAKSVYGKKQFKKKFGKKGGSNFVKDEFEQKILDIARVTRVMAGGKRMRFRACVAVGDKKGSVGVALAKSKDTSSAVRKSLAKAKKSMVKINVTENGSIPHEVKIKDSAAKIYLKPAPLGAGIIAGGAIRQILDLAGIQNISAKILGTNNQINNAYALMKALKSLRPIAEVKVEKKDG